MIKHVPNTSTPYHLYTKDGSRLLGKHETKAQAEAQETAINIRKHASVSRSRAQSALQTLLGTPYANTATNPILRTPWARNHEIYSRVLGALSGGFYGGSEALTNGISGRVFDESIADYLATQDPLPRALLTAAMIGGGAMLGSRAGGALSATKHLTLAALRPMLRENSDFLGLLDTARDFSV